MPQDERLSESRMIEKVTYGLMRGCRKRDDGKPSLGHEAGNGGYRSRAELNITAPVFYSAGKQLHCNYTVGYT